MEPGPRRARALQSAPVPLPHEAGAAASEIVPALAVIETVIETDTEPRPQDRSF